LPNAERAGGGSHQRLPVIPSQQIDDLLAHHVPRWPQVELGGLDGAPLQPPVANAQVLVTIADNRGGDRPPLDANALVRTSPKALVDTAPVPPTQAAVEATDGSETEPEGEPFASGIIDGQTFLKEG